MDKGQARKIIRDAFESRFDHERYIRFLRELLNSFDDEGARVNQGARIPEKFQDHVEKIERIGKYTEEKNEIMLFIVYLKRETAIERARTMQRNFVAWYLSQGEKDAALVAYVSPEHDDWRFSLVKMDYKFDLPAPQANAPQQAGKAKTGKVKVKEEFTPARRWSFLVGANEKSHTAQSRLVKILADDEHAPTLAELEEAFNIETVTKEFFLKYRELFLRTKEALDKVVENDPKIKTDFDAKGVDTVNFAKKLLGQIVFLYFLQKKGWFGVGRDDDWGTGSKHFLRQLFAGTHGSYQNFFNDILKPLFYEALRIDRSHDDDYYSHFNCKIPFLNGGLFDPIGNYDWVHTDINLPNDLFSNMRRTKEDDTGDGILDVFDRYNFTVREDEPLEKEVAIDPELLGKAYEKFNAIRPDNFEEFTKALKSGRKGEENKFNKKFGVYYTPREIVHYMCKQSLIQYLDSALDNHKKPLFIQPASQLKLFGDKTPEQQLLALDSDEAVVSRQDIEDLIEIGEMITEHEATALVKQENIKNGTQQSTKYTALLPGSIRKNAKLIDDLLADITVCDPAAGSGAFPVGMMNEIVRARNVLSVFLNNQERSDYEFKRRCIEHSLYGVDIDPGAVEIAKLRLWLSLVVDEEDIKNIKPLPNLDYKIVCGNSLLGYPYAPRGLEKIEKLKEQYFNETRPSEKNRLKKQIDEAIYNLFKNTETSLGYKVSMDFKVNFSEVFHNKGGFDVVIANPPYVEHKKLKSVSPFLKSFKVYSGTADLYVYFYEVALSILREAGILTLISSNKFIRARYRSLLRGLLAKNRIHKIVDFTEVKVFDALVASCIILVSKIKPEADVAVTFADDTYTNNLAGYIASNHIKVPVNSLSTEIWQLNDKTKLKVKQRIEANTEKLGSVNGVRIFRGITTGYNPAFIIDEKKYKEFISRYSSNKKVIKPLLQGRNIKKWFYKTTNEYLLFIPWHFPLHKDPNISGAYVKAENSFKNDYPDIYSHLYKFKDDLARRNKEETGIRYEWYALQRCAASYYPEFEKEKIIWGLTADKWAFAYDDKGHYLPSNGYILTSSSLTVKYLLALLNSRLMQFYFSLVGIMTAGGAYTLKHETIASLPSKKVSISEQKLFTTLVHHILAITKDDDYLQNPQKQAQVKEYERQIDQMVYELYGLTDEEIRIVEGKGK